MNDIQHILADLTTCHNSDEILKMSEGDDSDFVVSNKEPSIEFSEEIYNRLTNQLIKIFNQDDLDLVEPPEDKKNEFSYKKYDFVKKYKLPQNTPNQRIPTLAKPLVPREIAMNWFKENEIEPETIENEGLFAGYVVSQITERNINLCESVNTILTPEQPNSPIKLEFTEFWQHFCTHIQANFQEFEYLRKTIRMNGTVNINLLYDWILLYSASFRSHTLFNMMYQHTDFPEKFIEDKNTFFNFFCRSPNSQSGHSIVTNLLYDTQSVNYMVDTFGLVNVWKMILHNKTVDNQTTLRITNQLWTILLLYFNKPGSAYESVKLLPKKNSDDYGTILNMLSEYKSTNGDNIIHIITRLIGYKILSIDEIVQIDIYKDLFEFHKYLLKIQNNDGYLPVSYLHKLHKHEIFKLIDAKFISLNDLCEFSDSITSPLCYLYFFHSSYHDNETNYCEDVTQLDPEKIINIYICALSFKQHFITSGVWSESQFESIRLSNFKKIFKTFANDKNILKKNIKLYHFDREYPMFAIMLCLGFGEPCKVFYDLFTQYPFMLGNAIKTEKHVYKLSSFAYDEGVIKHLVKKDEKKYEGIIKKYYRSIKKHYTLPDKINSTNVATFFKNIKCDNIDDICLRMYYILFDVAYSDAHIDVDQLSIISDSELTDELYKHIVSTSLYFFDKCTEKGSERIVDYLYKLYYMHEKKFSQIFTNVVMENNDWIIWESLGKKLYRDNKLQEITLDIINSRKLKAHEILDDEIQVESITYFSRFITDYDFLENFCEKKSHIISSAFDSLNIEIIQTVTNLPNFDWVLLYNTFVNIGEHIDKHVSQQEIIFLNWLYCKLEQTDAYNNFMKHVAYNEGIISCKSINCSSSEFVKYIVFLLSKKIVTVELYGTKFHDFLSVVVQHIYRINSDVDPFNGFVSSLTEMEFGMLLGLNKYEECYNKESNEGYLSLFVAMLDIDCIFTKRLFSEFKDFWKDKKMELYHKNSDLFLKKINVLVEYNFIDIELVKLMLLDINEKNVLTTNTSSNNAVINEVIHPPNNINEENNEEDRSESNYSELEQDEEIDIEPTIKPNEIVNKYKDNTLLNMLTLIFDNFDICDLISDSSFETNELLTFVTSNKQNYVTFLNKLISLIDEELNTIVATCEMNGYNLLNKLFDVSKTNNDYVCNELLNFVCRCKSPETITQEFIETLLKKTSVCIFDEYVKISILLDKPIQGKDMIIKQFPQIILYFPNFENIVTKLDVDTLASILRQQKSDIKTEKQDFILNHVATTMDKHQLISLLENVHVISNFFDENVELISEVIKIKTSVLQNLISLDGFPKTLIHLESNNGDYLLVTVPVSKISDKVAKMFVELLTSEDLLKTNKRGNFKILNFLFDPYIKHLIKRSDISQLFSNKKIGQIMFDELMKSSITKSFNEIIQTYPDFIINSDFTDTDGNNFYMSILETFKKESIDKESISDDFIEKYFESLKQLSNLSTVLSHKNYEGNNLLFSSVHHDKFFRRMFKLYVEILGDTSLIEANNNNETLVMYVVRHNLQLLFGIIENNLIKEDNSYVYVNTGSVLTHSIMYQKDVDTFNDLLNWKNLSKNTLDTTQKIQLFDWNTNKLTKSNASVAMLACIYNKDIFKTLLDLEKFDMTRDMLHMGNEQYDIFEVAYLYTPESFQYLIGSRHVYENFPNEKHKEFFIKYAGIQPGSWYNFVVSKYYHNAKYGNTELWKLHWALRPADITHSSIARYIQTKNECTVKSEEICEICMNFRKKIMFGCLRHITCVCCAYKAEECPVCKNSDRNRIKVLD